MRKIPTLFLRDPDDMRRVTREVNPAAAWVLDGEGRATRKFDGTCVMIDERSDWWARREVKPGKQAPPGFVAVETDPETGKTVGWEPIDQSPFFTVFLSTDHHFQHTVGTFELCGPKINGNPEGLPEHRLVPHGQFILNEVPTDHEGLAGYLAKLPYEGIVWHHADGRMAKIKRRDFRSAW